MKIPVMAPSIELPRWLLHIVNQLYELEVKMSGRPDLDSPLRNVSRIKATLEELGLFYVDPMGQPFNETRTDLEASISGEGTEGLRVVQVMKPIIRVGRDDAASRVIQRGIVVVESQAGAEL